MPLQKLTADQLTGRPRTRSRGATSEYVAFLRSLRVGQGGKAIVEGEGVSRQSIKGRLKKAAQEAGVTIKFHRSSPGEVVFEVTDK